jgi:uncharacterized membrane protein
MTRSVKGIFAGSMVLNLLLLGIVLGRAPRGFEAPRTREQRLDAALTKIPEPAQSRLRDTFSRIRATADPLRRQTDEARAEALRLLSAEPFNESAYDRQVSKIEELRAEMYKRVGQQIKQSAKELSPEERRMFADVLRRPRPPSS